MPLDFSTTQWFDVASRISGGTNQPTYPANEYPVIGSVLYVNGGGYGWQTAPAFQESTRAVDPKVYCSANGASTGNSLIIDTPNGDYDFSVFFGSSAVDSTRAGVIVFDGNDIKFNSPFMSRSTSVANNTFRIADDSSGMYVSSGPTGTTAAVAPTFNGQATVVDGGVTWNLYAKVLHAFDSGAAPAIVKTQVYDATGATVSEASVATTRATKSVHVSRGGISVCKHPNTNQVLRSVGLKLQTQPLLDATLTDVYGSAVVGSPVIHAAQPKGTPLFRLAAPVGATNWSINPACDLAPYVEVQTLTAPQNSLPGVWVVTNGVPIPDTLASGAPTLGVIQTDPSTSISNSPHPTTFTATLVSSNGRTFTDTAMENLLVTQAWLIAQKVKAAMATRFMGYQGQPFTTDTLVTDSTSFAAAWNALPSSAANTNWYRIRCGGGSVDYTSTSLGLNDKDLGSGGVLIEPAAGSDPAFNFFVSAGVVINRAHFRGLRMPFVKTVTGSPTGGFLFKDPGPSATFFTRVIFENNRFGAMYHTGASETDINTLTGGDGKPVFFYHAAQAEFRGNKFDGCGNAITINGARLIVIEDNECLRAVTDFIAFSPFNDYWNTSTVTSFGDGDQFVSIRNNTCHAELDYAGFTNGNHGDFRQWRLFATQQWAANSPRSIVGPVPWAVGNRSRNGDKVYIVSAATTGTTGPTGPTGTGTGIVDGGVTWDYVMTLPAITVYEVFSGNRMISTSVASADATSDRQLFFSNAESGTPYTHKAAIFDNKECVAAKNGISCAYPGEYWVQNNTLLGPPALNPAITMLAAVIQTLGGPGKLFAQNNICAGVLTPATGQFQAFNQRTANTSDFAGGGVGTTLQGQFADDGSGRAKWSRTDGWTDSAAKAKAEVDLVMDKQLRPKGGVGAGGSMMIPFTVSPAGGAVGASLSTSVTVVP